MKTSKQLERYFKGTANHHRIDILRFVYENEGVSLDQIADALDVNMKTLSEHTKRLVQAGLLNKEYRGRQVAHRLSPYGEKFYKFMKTF